ncbi:MAG: shikimate dehydrogenase [Anaerolineales bacterium]
MFFHLGLIGYPLGHSLSPKIHAAALESCGLRGDYSLFPIAPDDQQGLRDLLARVRSGAIHGLNVTIPHKQNVISLLDELTPTAQAIGAVNTIYRRGDKLIGENTDAAGFLSDVKKFLADSPFGLQRSAVTTYPKRNHYAKKLAKIRANSRLREALCGSGRQLRSALILGAGGSARAVVYALVRDGWEVTIAARRLEQAQELASHDARAVYALRITHDELSSLPAVALVVNATPVGMAPNIHHSPWPANLPFPPHAAVYDLVYNPSETQLVKDARAAGLPATTGLGMLVEQAALSFERWTGRRPERSILWLIANTAH